MTTDRQQKLAADIDRLKDVTTYPEALTYWQELADREARYLVASSLTGTLTDEEVARKLALLSRIGAAITFVAGEHAS